MEGSYNPESVHRPPQSMRGPRGYKPFKNPPQPHMCIQDSIRGTTEKLYINVMSWKQIANTKQCADLIPLYGGMQIPHGCTPNCNRPPLIVFAVMVNPEILKINGKNATSPQERDALVSLLCDFVEAMNPGLFLTKKPTILKDRDLAGELKDVWHAVQAHREKEKLKNQEHGADVTHKIYHIDGPDNEKKADNTPATPDNNYNNDVQVLCENVNNTINTNQSRTDQTIPNNVDQPSTANFNHESKENLTNSTDEKESEKCIDLKEYSPPKYEKQKQDIHYQTPSRYNPKQKANAQDKQSFDDSKTEMNHITACSDLKQHSENAVHAFNSLSLNDQTAYSNYQNQNASAKILLSDSLNFDNKDIPFVDGYHDKICDQSESEKASEVLQKHIIEPTTNKSLDSPVSNVNDQKKVSLSSQ